ncbi:hypothetical protein RHGRI_027217 [Rhododendron griersonianum]|uniref:Uncharacterized protein n=1 Tax=Rhododendron griersonianum TaxID=479676 RepID=A0AAV6IXY5_9ERIC|nr:hypothetical protein RHGRI_027217 [Rhododendron griersonianum]
MGTALLLQFPSSSTAPSLPLLLPNRRNPLLLGGTRCRSTGHGGRSGRPHWDSNAEKTHRAERFRFNYEDDVGRENDVGGGFGFREGAKKRVWWSDEDTDDDDDDKGGFGGLEEALDTSWILKDCLGCIYFHKYLDDSQLFISRVAYVYLEFVRKMGLCLNLEKERFMNNDLISH